MSKVVIEQDQKQMTLAMSIVATGQHFNLDPGQMANVLCLATSILYKDAFEPVMENTAEDFLSDFNRNFMTNIADIKRQGVN